RRLLQLHRRTAHPEPAHSLGGRYRRARMSGHHGRAAVESATLVKTPGRGGSGWADAAWAASRAAPATTPQKRPRTTVRPAQAATDEATGQPPRTRTSSWAGLRYISTTMRR